MPGSGLLRSSSRIGARLFSPFYRRFPYRGAMDIFKLDPRGAYSPLEPFFYNRVPKAANTSITQTLFTHSTYRPRLARRDNPKYKFQRPIFLSPSQVHKLEHEAFKFTFVRNPYSRVLSAYLDKVGRRKHQGLRFLAWAEANSQPASFLGFCRYLDAGGLFLDMHWAPQVEILCLPLECFDFIGRIESIDRDLNQVLQRVFNVQLESPLPQTGRHHTQANQKLKEAYGMEERQIVNRLYATDFLKLGYPQDL
jgi:hypothetical protein